MKDVQALQVSDEGHKQVAEKMEENLATQDLYYCAQICMREKEVVDTVQKEYDEFKAHINTHAISS